MMATRAEKHERNCNAKDQNYDQRMPHHYVSVGLVDA
jgi:hypothetical protein